MNLKPVLVSLLPLLATLTFSQTPNTPTPANESDSIVAARCRYTQHDDACRSLEGTIVVHDAKDAAVAQIPRGPRPGFPRRPPRMMGYPGGHPYMYMGEGSGRAAAIGAAIGFSVGAAMAARSNGGVRATVGVGVLFATVGAAMGYHVSAFPSPHHYRRSWPDDDDELASAKSGRERRAQRTAQPQRNPNSNSATEPLSADHPETAPPGRPKEPPPSHPHLNR